MKARSYLVFVLLLCTSAAARAAGLGLSGEVMDAFKSILNGVEAGLRPAALGLFGTLMAIELGVWTTKKVLHDEFTIESIAPQLAWKMIIWCFFFWLLKNSHTILSAIVDTFFQFGENATGLKTLDATGLLEQGVATSLAMINKASLGPLSFLDKPLIVLTAIVAMLLLLLAFVVAAAQLVMAQVETMVVVAAAPVLLSFGALSFTREIATNVMKHALSTGVKVLTIYIIAGVMVKIGPVFAKVLANNSDQLFSNPGQLFEIIGIAGLMVLMAFFVPTIASSMLSGSSGMSGTAALGAAMGAAAAAATGGAAAMGGLGGAAKAAGSSAGGAVAGATGLAAALNAGLTSASDHGLSGLAAGGHALGKVAEHGLGMAGDAVGSAAESAKSAFGGKVDQSIGGQIANGIQAERGGSVAGVPAHSTNAGSGTPAAPASTPAPQNSASSGSLAAGAPGGASVQADVAPGPVAEAGPTPSYNIPAPAAAGPAPVAQNANLAGDTPAGDASSATLSGASQTRQPQSTLGRVSDAFNRASDLLDASKEHLIEDNTAVSASIDHRAAS